MIPRWLRGWRERDDRHLFKAADVDPVDELIRAINEAQEADAAAERRLYPPVRVDRPSTFRRHLPDRRWRQG
jgi:hypothetical protein